MHLEHINRGYSHFSGDNSVLEKEEKKTFTMIENLSQRLCTTFDNNSVEIA